MEKGVKKANNRHAIGNGNGKFGKKAARIERAATRIPRSPEERLMQAGKRELARLKH